MLIKDLPKDIRIIAKIRTKKNKLEYEDDLHLESAFTWIDTKEGHEAWSAAACGDFETFRETRKQLKQEKNANK